MISITRKLLCIFVGLFSLLNLNNCCAENQDDTAMILKKLNQIATTSKTVIGVTAINIETNRKVSYNNTMPFFMASTIKVPIAVTLLHRVDQKQDDLDRSIHLATSNAVPGSGKLHYSLAKGPVNITLRQLLQLMLTVSDNSASDALLREVNGPKAVTQRMRELGLNHIYVSRSLIRTYIDTEAVNPALLQTPHSIPFWKKEFTYVPITAKIRAWLHFQNDFRDTATPDDMAVLLAKLYKGQILSPANTNLLIHTMEECRTGSTRIKKFLPAGTEVADKTGTWGIYTPNYLKNPASKSLYRFASDVGVITLPQNKGHVAIAVYVKSKAINDHDRCHVIALVSRALYDYFS